MALTYPNTCLRRTLVLVLVAPERGAEYSSEHGRQRVHGARSLLFPILQDNEGSQLMAGYRLSRAAASKSEIPELCHRDTVKRLLWDLRPCFF